MRKWNLVMAVLMALLILNHIVMRIHINVQDDIIRQQRETIRSEREHYRMYVRRCDSLITRYDSLCNEIIDRYGNDRH